MLAKLYCYKCTLGFKAQLFLFNGGAPSSLAITFKDEVKLSSSELERGSWNSELH